MRSGKREDNRRKNSCTSRRLHTEWSLSPSSVPGPLYCPFPAMPLPVKPFPSIMGKQHPDAHCVPSVKAGRAADTVPRRGRPTSARNIALHCLLNGDGMAVRERTQSQSLFAATTSESGRVVSTRSVCLCCSSSHRQSRHDSPGPLHSIYRHDARPSCARTFTTYPPRVCHKPEYPNFVPHSRESGDCDILS